MVSLIFRLIGAVFLLVVIFAAETYLFVSQNLMANNELSLVDAGKIFIGQEPYPDVAAVFRIKDSATLQAVDAKFLFYDESDARDLIFLDENGAPAEDQTDRQLKETVPPSNDRFFLIKDLWAHSWVQRLFLHWILLALVLLISAKDTITSIMERSAPKRAEKALQKRAKKLIQQAEGWLKAGQTQKVREKMADPSLKQGLPKDVIIQLDFYLGKALLADGVTDEAIPLLKRASTEENEAEIQREIGAAIAKNPAKARTQDLPYMIAHVEANPSDTEFCRFFAGYAIKLQTKDKRSVRSLIKILDTPAGSPQIAEYLLKVLSEAPVQDEMAIDFYEHYKSVDPENPTPYLLLSEHKLTAGEFDTALDDLEKLLELDYENQRVHDMLFTIYQLKEKLNDLFQIYAVILEQVPNDPIALTQQRKIQQDPGFDQDDASSRSKMSLQEMLALRKGGDSSVETDILKKYERTLTIMFTDIKGYTKMTESQSPLETMQILQESDEILPPIIARHEGVVIKKIGDAFMARFETADSAVIASVQIQQAIWKNNKRREDEGKVRWEIRVGLNTGPVIVKDGDVFGDAVNTASRVESNSEANEVFVTEATKEAMSNKKIEFTHRGAKQVKGKAEPLQLFSVNFDLEGNSIS